MTRTLCVAMLMCLTSGCGTREESGTAAHSRDVDLSTLPLTVEGTLVADVGEGDVDEDGDGGEYSEVNFGTLTVGGEEILVQVSGSVLRSANLPEAEGEVRATIGSKSSEYGATYYEITELERL